MDNNDYAYNKRGRIVLLLRSYQHAAAAASPSFQQAASSSSAPSFFRCWLRDDAVHKVKERMKRMGEDTDRLLVLRIVKFAVRQEGRY